MIFYGYTHNNISILLTFAVITLIYFWVSSHSYGRFYSGNRIQVAYKITEQSTIDREFKPLLEVKDHHPKYVVTMDEY
jgi:hypothetical protein